jgi:hypothetical protein
LIWIKAIGIEDGNCEKVTTRMQLSVIVWDLETVPDLRGFAAANDLVGKSDVEVREATNQALPKASMMLGLCVMRKVFLAFSGACASILRSAAARRLGDKFPKHIYHSIICIGAPHRDVDAIQANTHPFAQASMKLSEAMYGPAQAGFRNDGFCCS